MRMLFVLLLMLAPLAATNAEAQGCTSSFTFTSLSSPGAFNNTYVGDTVNVRTTITSACAISSVTASALGHSGTLLFSSSNNRWDGSVSIAGEASGEFTLTVTVTDVNSNTASSTLTLNHALKPVVNVTLPTQAAFTRSNPNIVGTCTDPDSSGCTSFQVFVNGLIRFSGTDSVNSAVSLTGLSGTEVRIEFRGTDGQGQTTSVFRYVYHDTSTGIGDLAHVTGRLVDASDQYLLWMNGPAKFAQTPMLTNRMTMSTTTLATGGDWDISTPVGSAVIARGGVTSTGAVVHYFKPSPCGGTEPSSCGRVLESKNGVQTDLGPLALNEPFVVAGDYAAWRSAPKEIVYRDIAAGTTTVITTATNADALSMAPNGDLTYCVDAGLTRYRGGTNTVLATDNCHTSKTDGVNAVIALPNQLKVIQPDSSIATITVAGEDGLFELNNGWIAFRRAAQGGTNIWLRSPAGVETQITSFADHLSFVGALNSDGRLTITRNGRVYLYSVAGLQADLSTTLARSFFRSNEVRLTMGDTLFTQFSIPVITSHPASTTIAAGQSTTLSVTATGQAPITYQWFQGASGDMGSPIAGATSSSYTTPALTAKTNLFWAQVANGIDQHANSNTATVTTYAPFVNDPLVAGETTIQAVHIIELRSRVAALRSGSGLGAFSYSDANPTAGSTLITARYITELRTALNDVYVARGLTPPTYTDASLSAGMAIKAVHITQLRAAVIAIE
jgi:hypothetical protein